MTCYYGETYVYVCLWHHTCLDVGHFHALANSIFRFSIKYYYYYYYYYYTRLTASFPGQPG